MRRGRWKTWTMVVMAVLLLASAAMLIGPIKDLRREYDFDPGDSLMDEDVASELRLPVAALSVFRSLAIDYLWIRAETLKEEGHHFDALHLSRLICSLAPNLAEVWVFHAWNMSYNISVSMENPPERWNWVMAGISLLRDEGLKHNPRSPQIYSYLANIFQHKMGEISDDHHRYYKLRLALEMEKIVGQHQETMNTFLQFLTAAPRQWSEVIADPNVAELVGKIQETEPERFPDATALQEGLLDFITYRDTFDYSEEFKQLMNTHSRRYTLLRLSMYLRRRELWNKWKMDPAVMLELNAKYGPYDNVYEGRRLSLDWRQPFAHAIYWAWLGMPYTSMKDDFYFLRIRQNIYHSMQKLFEMGHITIYDRGKPQEATEREPGQEIVDRIAQNRLGIFNSQDLRMFVPAYEAFVEVVQSYKDLGEEVPENVYSAAFAYFLWSGIENLYLAGYKETALKYFLDLRRRFPKNPDYFIKKSTVGDSLIAFVQMNVQEELNEIGPKVAANYIDSLLRQSCAALSQDNLEVAVEMESHARRIHQHYQIEREEVDSNRVKLPPFPQMQFEALANFLDDPQINPMAKNTLMARIRIANPSLYKQVTEELDKRRRSSIGAVGRE
jgi:hypothetical protein